jgi:hypothetical protein
MKKKIQKSKIFIEKERLEVGKAWIGEEGDIFCLKC